MSESLKVESPHSAGRNFDSVIYTFEFDLTKFSVHVNFRFPNVVTNGPLTILQHTLTW